MIGVKRAVSVHGRVKEIGRDAREACAGNPEYQANPFISYDFLDILEESNCAVERTGWGPRHVAVEDECGQTAAVMPLYLKSHSQGEYIFDGAWADAYMRAGGDYYPKLQCASVRSLPVRPTISRPACASRRSRRIVLRRADESAPRKSSNVA